MRFKAYEICYFLGGDDEETDSIKIIEDIDHAELYSQLNKFPRIKEGTQEYTIMYNNDELNIITGVLAQTYNPMLSKFVQGNTKEEIPIPEDTANDKTYFYIDTMKKQLFIQNKRFPTKTLNINISLRRMENILSRIFSKVIHLNPIFIEYGVEELIQFFNNAFVTKIEYTNLSGLKLPLNAALHNPREELDRSLVETWNTYCEGSVDSFELKASNNKSLNKNPLAKIGIYLAKEAGDIKHGIIKKLTINDAGGTKEELKPKGNEFKVIHIPSDKQEDHHYVFDKIFSTTIKFTERRNNKFD